MDSRASNFFVGAIAGALVGLALLATIDTPSYLYAPSATVIKSIPAAATSSYLPKSANFGRTYASSPLSWAQETDQVESTMAQQPQAVEWRHLQWALVAFTGVMACLNAAYYYVKRRPVAFAAMAGEKDEEMALDRRQFLAGASAAAGLFAASPAHALFGFGEDANKVYAEDSTKMLNQIKSVLVLDNNDPTKPDQIAALRKDMNGWVAKYRRDTRFSGRASYGNLYAVINAIAGHYTNFGAKTPIPKKRAAQIVTEIGQAEILITKGR